MSVDTFDKVCGRFRLTVSLPHPYWVKLTQLDGGDEGELRHVNQDDLPDLQYLIESARAAVLANEKQWGRA